MEYTIVGKIINTHGINGEVKVYPYTNDIERFSDLEYAYIGDKKLKVELRAVKYYKGLVIIKLKEYDNINDVLNFRDNLLYVHDSDRIDLPEDQYFIHDLLDCEVMDISGNRIGYIADVLQYASNDIYVVKNYENNNESLVPAVKEFIKEVNIGDKKIIISPIEGMIE